MEQKNIFLINNKNISEDELNKVNLYLSDYEVLGYESYSSFELDSDYFPSVIGYLANNKDLAVNYDGLDLLIEDNVKKTKEKFQKIKDLLKQSDYKQKVEDYKKNVLNLGVKINSFLGDINKFEYDERQKIDSLNITKEEKENKINNELLPKIREKMDNLKKNSDYLSVFDKLSKFLKDNELLSQSMSLNDKIANRELELAEGKDLFLEFDLIKKAINKVLEYTKEILIYSFDSEKKESLVCCGNRTIDIERFNIDDLSTLPLNYVLRITKSN
jgi:hypothetical protein